MIDYSCLHWLWEGAVVAQVHGLAISARYTVMSGTPEKILELLLEAMRPDSSAHDPTGRGRRQPACCLTYGVVKYSLGKGHTPATDLTGCWIIPWGQSAGSPHSCALTLGGEHSRGGWALLVPCPCGDGGMDAPAVPVPVLSGFGL